MSNNSDSERQGSLNEALELIKTIFDKERTNYEKTIKSLKNRISELELALDKANKENIGYQTKISNLKRKLTSISKTVSKLEDSDFESKNELEKIIFITNKDNYYNNIKYRNKENMNSFRKKTKFISNINRSVSDNYDQYMKNNFIDNNDNKQFNDGEDIKSNYYNKINNANKPNKKALSSRIKNSLLNLDHAEEKSRSRKNNLFKSYANNGENHSLYLHSNCLNEKNKNLILHENFDKKCNSNKIKYLSADKYHQIEQKINGMKSNLNIYREKEESKVNNSRNNYSTSINEENSLN